MKILGGMIDKLDGRTPATTPVLPPNTNLDTSADGSVTTQSSQGSNGSSTGMYNFVVTSFSQKFWVKSVINHHINSVVSRIFW